MTTLAHVTPTPVHEVYMRYVLIVDGSALDEGGHGRN